MRPSIKRAVEWIALNDEPDDMNIDSVSSFISVHLAAELFGKSSDYIARRVIRFREEERDGDS